MLFHFHYWTPHVEETETFYLAQGFRVQQRIGREDGEFQSYDPPLDWNDFRGRPIMFRIIEMRRGRVNVTFGYGKRVKFDHIGFFVVKEELEHICQKAESLKWNVRSNERRTFISTPYGFQIELQQHQDIFDAKVHSQISSMEIQAEENDFEKELNYLFGSAMNISITQNSSAALKKVGISGLDSAGGIDPNGVLLVCENKG
ncbi:hypothetical protein [Falsibacillus albus]|uniref:VOC domain-containing protein n=1 Tax=Falsibacillus albus TaxID=2478915 RepID=A0A3L7JQY8_9BACI|nr:hypothetical protein [Falsibacillus albus]RLQ93237.1 hypothetical protein D9X91_18595 [Falsibacillus albus]